MLTELLHSQCKQLLDQHLQFYNDKQLLADKVVSEEVRNRHSLLLWWIVLPVCYGKVLE